MWAIFKVFIEFVFIELVTILLLFFVLFCFLSWGMWDLNSQSGIKSTPPALDHQGIPFNLFFKNLNSHKTAVRASASISRVYVWIGKAYLVQPKRKMVPLRGSWTTWFAAPWVDSTLCKQNKNKQTKKIRLLLLLLWTSSMLGCISISICSQTGCIFKVHRLHSCA